MSGQCLFTRQGLQILRERIDALEAELQKLQSQVAHAAEVGGNQYHDNASYELLEIDIRGVDHQLSEAHRTFNRAVLVDAPKNNSRVAIGTKVVMSVNGEMQEWLIGGYGESDPDRSIIAYNAPLAELIMGKRKGEIAEGNIGGRGVQIKIGEILVAEIRS